MFFLHPRFRRPLERGSMSGVTKRCNGIKRKGTQSPSSQRRPAFSVVGVKNMARPEGAQALRAIQEALDGGRSLPVVNYILPI